MGARHRAPVRIFKKFGVGVWGECECGCEHGRGSGNGCGNRSRSCGSGCGPRVCGRGRCLRACLRRLDFMHENQNQSDRHCSPIACACGCAYLIAPRSTVPISMARKDPTSSRSSRSWATFGRMVRGDMDVTDNLPQLQAYRMLLCT